MLQEDVLDALRRQLDELEALRCMYPDVQPPVLQLDDHQRQALALAAHCCGGGNSGAGDWAMLTGSDDSCGLAHAAAADGRGCRSDAGRGGVDQGVDGGVLEAMAQEALREDTLPLLSGTIRPPDLSYGGEPVALRFTLPRAYHVQRLRARAVKSLG